MSVVGYGAVVRGDTHKIVVGKRSMIGDKAIVHTRGSIGRTLIGDDVYVGESAIVHACVVEDECWIGAGSIVLDGSVISKGTVIAPGSLVLAGTRTGFNEYWEGSPAKCVRVLEEEERKMFKEKLEEQHQVAKANQTWMEMSEQAKDEMLSNMDTMEKATD
eukprot:TRINITY_DN6130_c0_g1_i2.p1 TRINITY_DN6130_c0_g1~~TRINITY_DN6130_c0_g1_i2.p1  ORF type:complete len:161 (-),score=48.06 TRINITY_DN6130_c0_g1_i2:187-669(-)